MMVRRVRATRRTASVVLLSALLSFDATAVLAQGSTTVDEISVEGDSRGS